jgi:hypothetical protein
MAFLSLGKPMPPEFSVRVRGVLNPEHERETAAMFFMH